MEDLVPLVFFLVIVAVNVLKFFLEKSGKAKKTPDQSPGTPPKRTSPLEAFFADLAEQMAPKPTDVPDWPEGRERPDYLQEMEEFQHAPFEEPEEEQIAEIIPFSAPEPVASVQKTTSSAKIHTQPTQPTLSGSHGLRMPSIYSGTTNRHPFRIKGKKTLKQAILAHIVFSPPRAFDLSFDNTIAKRS